MMISRCRKIAQNKPEKNEREREKKNCVTHSSEEGCVDRIPSKNEEECGETRDATSFGSQRANIYFSIKNCGRRSVCVLVTNTEILSPAENGAPSNCVWSSRVHCVVVCLCRYPVCNWLTVVGVANRRHRRHFYFVDSMFACGCGFSYLPLY